MIQIRNFIPEHIKANKKAYNQAYLLFIVNLYILFSSILLGSLYYFTGFISGAFVMGMSAILAVIFLPIIMNAKKLNIAGNYFIACSIIIFSAMAYITGGIESPNFVWFISIPPVVVLYFEKRQAQVWVPVTAAMVLFFGVLKIMEIPTPNQMPASLLPFIIWFNYGVLLTLILIIFKAFMTYSTKIRNRLKSANRNLSSSNEELERFAYIASHDLKSPLRNIVSFSTLMKRKYQDKLDEDGLEYLQIIHSNAKQMHNLVEDILEYSTTKKQKINKEIVNLNKLLDRLQKQIQLNPQFQDSIITIGDMPHLMCDYSMFSQLFQNLITNGLKYNESSPKSVKIDYERIGAFIHFKIEDNGIGIDPAFHTQIFEMFKRLHNNVHYKGTGIGLAICMKIIDSFNGKVTICSEKGAGSVFNISFPADMLIHEDKVSFKPIEATQI